MKRIFCFVLALLVEASAVAGPFAISAVPVPAYVGSMTYATLTGTYACSATLSGAEGYASDWGANGTKVRCNGTRWLPINGSTVLKRLAAAVSGITNTETIAAQVQVPAGVLQIGDIVRVTTSVTKSGTTDNCMHAWHVGTAGTTSDASVVPLLNVLVTTNVSGGFLSAARVTSNTLMLKLGSNANGSQYGGPGNVAAAVAVTVSDVSSNAMWISYSAKSSSTTDTCGVQDVTITQEAG